MTVCGGSRGPPYTKCVESRAHHSWNYPNVTKHNTVRQSPSFFPCLSAVIRDALLWRPVRERDVITARLAQEVIIPPEGADVSNCAARTRRSSGLHTPHKVRLRPGERHR